MATADNSISDNFAPNWIPYFSPEGDVLPDVCFAVDCGVCSNRLAISQPSDGDNIEEFAVLPCGHAFGFECIKTWLESSATPTCPSCRFSLWYSECEHVIVPWPLYLGDGYNMRQSISDCIGDLRPKCRDCRRGDRRRSPHGNDRNREGEFHDEHFDNPHLEFSGLNFGYGPRNPPSGQFPIHPEDIGHGGFMYGPPRRSATFTGMPSAPDFRGPGRGLHPPHSQRSQRSHHGRHRRHIEEDADLHDIRRMVVEEFDERPGSRELTQRQRATAIDLLLNRVLRRLGRL